MTVEHCEESLLSLPNLIAGGLQGWHVHAKPASWPHDEASQGGYGVQVAARHLYGTCTDAFADMKCRYDVPVLDGVQRRQLGHAIRNNSLARSPATLLDYGRRVGNLWNLHIICSGLLEQVDRGRAPPELREIHAL